MKNSNLYGLVAVSCLILSVPLASLDPAATAAPSYKGDGAVPNGTGGWAQPPVLNETKCLECHGSGANHFLCGPGCAAPDKSSYLMTGHKNMLRKVAPGSPWAGADGTVYGTTDASYGSGSVYDWIAGTIDVAGAGTIRHLYYIFAGWLDPGQLNTVFDGGFTGELYPNGSYDCGRCHTTGYRFDASGPEPTTFDGTPITDAQFSRIPTDFTTGSSSWYRDGVECERCHRDVANEAGGHNCYIGGIYNPTYTSYASCTGGGGSWTVVVPAFENATALCIECHRQESADTATHTIALSTDLEVSDDGSCSDGTSPDYATCLANSATWNFAPFFDASMGQAFLNSPHARFAGTLAPGVQNSPDLSVSLTGTYNSHFKRFTPGPNFGNNLGCDGCHDVHQSLAEAVGALNPLPQKCPDCHAKSLAGLLHPHGTGTPLEDMATDPAQACQICHMPQSYHLFRISIDPNYSTFPTADEFYSDGETIANVASDGLLAGAVWNDLDLACGQCHGGSAGAGAVTHGAGYMDKATLAGYARGIHNDKPYATFSSRLGSPNTLTITVDATDSTCSGSGANCDAYDWNWGDGTADGSGVNASHTYATAGAKTITLTVEQYGVNGNSTTKKVNVYAPDAAPMVAGVCMFNANSWTESVTDTSTDDNGIKQVTVSWGDGSILANDTAAPFGPFSNIYLNAGTYTITHKAFDTIGQQSAMTCAATAAHFTISGTVYARNGTTPLTSAMVIVKKSATIVKTVYTSATGTYSAGTLKPGTYILTISKSGYTFAVPAATITVGPSSAGNSILATAP